MASNTVKDSAEEDLFKREFKRFKKLTNNDMNCILDFTQPHKFDLMCPVVDLPVESRDNSNTCASLGLKCLKEWNVFRVTSIPGLLFIPNPFLPGYQHLWVTQSLVHYPCLPNVSNVDAHMTRAPPGHIWDNQSAKEGNKDSLLYKLRWVTLGYHYDWSSKLYCNDHVSPFPSDLSLLTQFILKALGFEQFKAEAAIVNYYHLDSTLSGHTDHSESDLTAPLISLSFGQSAIFLIGGSTKQHKPLPLLINSGDIIIMSGDSRLAYHGVPKILSPPSLCSTQLIPYCLSEACLKNTLLSRIKAHSMEEEKCHFYGHTTSYLNSESLKRLRSESQDLLETKFIKFEPRDIDRTHNEICTSQTESRSTTNTNTQTEPHITLPIETHAHSFHSKPHTNHTETHTANTPIEKMETKKGESHIEDLVDCPNCQWMLMNWQYVESYLAYSRININVRQVGELMK